MQCGSKLLNFSLTSLHDVTHRDGVVDTELSRPLPPTFHSSSQQVKLDKFQLSRKFKKH